MKHGLIFFCSFIKIKYVIHHNPGNNALKIESLHILFKHS